MTVQYLRVVRQVIPYDRCHERREAANQATDGVIHMLNSHRWMTLEEVVAEAEQYNRVNDGPFDVPFETDRLKVAECLAALCGYGLVEVRILTEEGEL